MVLLELELEELLDELELLELEELDELSSEDVDELVVDSSMSPVTVLDPTTPVVVSSTVPELDPVDPADVLPPLALALALALIPVVRTPVVGSSLLVVEPSLAGGPLLSNGLITSELHPTGRAAIKNKAKRTRCMNEPRSLAP